MKLPKELQKQQAQAKQLRRRAPTKAKVGPGARPPVKGMNRQMRRKLQSQGIEGMEPIEATRVIIQTEDKDIVIEDPQVIALEQQGMHIYQVIGESKEVEKGALSYGVGAEAGEEEGEEEEELEETEPLTVEITEQDVQLVVAQTGVSPEVARNALKEVNGDLARAILNLKTRQ